MHDGIVAMVLRTFGSIYPFLEIWDCGSGDIIMLGAKQPWKNDLASYRKIFERELPRQQLQKLGLTTPESLLARQLASQRTAFAIAGDGPIQSDLFPVLEYEAPKAFYVGTYSWMLGGFDERTVQAPLAPDEKRAVLDSLGNDVLRKTFADYSSVNSSLIEIVKLRLNTNSLPNAASPVASLPSLFRPAHSPPSLARPAEGASEALKSLIDAANLLEADAARKPEAIQQIEALLLAQGEKTAPATNEWALSYFAVAGARHSLGLGDYQSAQRLLDLGRKVGPSDYQLDYLARILERERSLGTKLISARSSN
jgi:hypothetical protein